MVQEASQHGPQLKGEKQQQDDDNHKPKEDKKVRTSTVNGTMGSSKTSKTKRDLNEEKRGEFQRR